MLPMVWTYMVPFLRRGKNLWIYLLWWFFGFCSQRGRGGKWVQVIIIRIQPPPPPLATFITIKLDHNFLMQQKRRVHVTKALIWATLPTFEMLLNLISKEEEWYRGEGLILERKEEVNKLESWRLWERGEGKIERTSLTMDRKARSHMPPERLMRGMSQGARNSGTEVNWGGGQL